MSDHPADHPIERFRARLLAALGAPLPPAPPVAFPDRLVALCAAHETPDPVALAALPGVDRTAPRLDDFLLVAEAVAAGSARQLVATELSASTWADLLTQATAAADRPIPIHGDGAIFGIPVCRDDTLAPGEYRPRYTIPPTRTPRRGA